MEPKNSLAEIRDITPKTVEQLAIELAELDPKPITFFTPDNLDEVLADFLSGKIRNPDHATYSKLDNLDFAETNRRYQAILQEIMEHPQIPQKQHFLYKEYIRRLLLINELMSQAVKYRKAQIDGEKAEAQKRFEGLNSELYGDTEPVIASAMAKEVIADVRATKIPELMKISDDFASLLPTGLLDLDASAVNLAPSDEAKEFVHRLVQNIYAPFLKHSDRIIRELADEEEVEEDKLKLNPQALAVIFQTIINEEFPDSGWKVELKTANAINVVVSEKKIVIPENRASVSPDKARGLVVHELGVHMLRSIIGEGADLIPMRLGLAGVGDAEEGIAKVVESDLVKDESRTGYQHYLTAHLLSRGYDFRDAFEVMWRYKVIDSVLNNNAEITEDFINKRKSDTAKFMFRSIRGTNKLPWHTTLSYFNGAHKIWEHIETHKDDPDLVTIVFMGKIDPTNPNHLWGALDAKSRV